MVAPEDSSLKGAQVIHQADETFMQNPGKIIMGLFSNPLTNIATDFSHKLVES